VGGVVGEGKPGLFGIDHAEAGRPRVHRVVEGVAQVAGDILGKGFQSTGELGGQPDLMNLVSCFTVHLDNASVWAAIKKSRDSRVKLVNVFARSLD